MKVVIEFDFEEFNEDDYTGYELVSIKRNDELTSIDLDGLRNIAELFAQSDFYWVGVTNALINIISGRKEYSLEEIKKLY